MERGSRLSDRYMIGEELGRGAYGQVWKAIDSTTGSSVAIKQISLNGTSQDNLQSVMGEIELLKTLNHRNIVKYQGSFKTRRYVVGWGAWGDSGWHMRMEVTCSGRSLISSCSRRPHHPASAPVGPTAQ